MIKKIIVLFVIASITLLGLIGYSHVNNHPKDEIQPDAIQPRQPQNWNWQDKIPEKPLPQPSPPAPRPQPQPQPPSRPPGGG